MRLELTTYSMASCRSSQLSYTRLGVGISLANVDQAAHIVP